MALVFGISIGRLFEAAGLVVGQFFFPRPCILTIVRTEYGTIYSTRNVVKGKSYTTSHECSRTSAVAGS